MPYDTQLLELNSTHVSTFNEVEDVLDGNVGTHVRVTVLRGGVVQSCSVKVRWMSRWGVVRPHLG